jgi:hypothetical protein
LNNWDDDVDIIRAWENIRENMKISAKVSLGYYLVSIRFLQFQVHTMFC